MCRQSESELFLLEAWVADNPGSRLFMKLAQAYRGRLRLQEAAEVLRRGLVMRPDDLEARQLLADVLGEMGDDAGALEQLTNAAQEISRHAGIFERLSVLWEKQGRDEEARTARQVARGLTSGPSLRAPQGQGQDTATMAEIYASQGYTRQAVEIYRKLVGANPDDPGLRARLAELEGAVEAAPASRPAAPPRDPSRERPPEPEPQPGDGDRAWLLDRLEGLRRAALARAMA